MKASFRVAEKYEVQCQWSVGGLERYSVDGKEVLRMRSLGLRGRRKFKVGKGKDEHEVEIEMDVVPRTKSWIFPGDWIAKAYVDGVLVVEDLTPRTRSKVRTIDRILNYGLVIGVVVLAVLGLLYVTLRYVIPH
jgi:hypothetical protein